MQNLYSSQSAPSFKDISNLSHNYLEIDVSTEDDSIQDHEKDKLLPKEIKYYSDVSGNINNYNKNLTFNSQKKSCCKKISDQLFKQKLIIVFLVVLVFYLFSAMICGWDWNDCSN